MELEEHYVECVNDTVYECCICLCTMETSVCIVPCGHSCCSSCGLHLTSCPECRVSIVQVIPNFLANSLVQSRMVQCIHCDSHVPYNGLRRHIHDQCTVCPFTVVPCTDCAQTMQRCELEKHICKEAYQACRLCKVEVKRKNMAKHTKKCNAKLQQDIIAQKRRLAQLQNKYRTQVQCGGVSSCIPLLCTEQAQCKHERSATCVNIKSNSPFHSLPNAIRIRIQSIMVGKNMNDYMQDNAFNSIICCIRDFVSIKSEVHTLDIEIMKLLNDVKVTAITRRMSTKLLSLRKYTQESGDYAWLLLSTYIHMDMSREADVVHLHRLKQKTDVSFNIVKSYIQDIENSLTDVVL